MQNLKNKLSIFLSGLLAFIIVFAVQVVVGIIPVFNLVLFSLQVYLGGLWYVTPRDFKFKGIHLVLFGYLITALLADIVVVLFYLGLGKGIYQVISNLF